MGGIAAAPVLVVVCGDTRLTYAPGHGRLGLPGGAEPAPGRPRARPRLDADDAARSSVATSCPELLGCRPRSCPLAVVPLGHLPKPLGHATPPAAVARRPTWTATATRFPDDSGVEGSVNRLERRDSRSGPRPAAPDTGVRSADRVSRCRSTTTTSTSTPRSDELWQLFWARIPHTETGDVTIDILHPGDAVGEGLVRHCTFRVPRYLLTGGKGQSWEWLTEVKPQGVVEVQRRRTPPVLRGRRAHAARGPGQRDHTASTSPRRTTPSTRSCAPSSRSACTPSSPRTTTGSSRSR